MEKMNQMVIERCGYGVHLQYEGDAGDALTLAVAAVADLAIELSKQNNTSIEEMFDRINIGMSVFVAIKLKEIADCE